jgi:hypothetical protein
MMTVGRRKARIAGGVAALLAAVLGLGGLTASPGPTGARSVVQASGTDDGGTTACVTSAEYAQAPRPEDCPGGGAQA